MQTSQTTEETPIPTYMDGTHTPRHLVTRFKYILSGVKSNETSRDVRRVVFNIGRYGHLCKRIDFSSDVTESEAIHAVEIWLSEPLRWQEFVDLKNAVDLFACEDRILSEFNCRGDALGDCRFLEVIGRNGSQITLSCGS
jgi:hypothetical protein